MHSISILSVSFVKLFLLFFYSLFCLIEESLCSRKWKIIFLSSTNHFHWFIKFAEMFLKLFSAIKFFNNVLYKSFEGVIRIRYSSKEHYFILHGIVTFLLSFSTFTVEFKSFDYWFDILLSGKMRILCACSTFIAGNRKLIYDGFSRLRSWWQKVV